MKKGVLLNSEISYVISKLGHGDHIVIGDSGLPVGQGCQRIDVAVSKGVPSFLQVLDAVVAEQRVEEVVLARETKTVSPEVYQEILKRVGEIQDREDYQIKVTEVSHEEFKAMSRDSKAVIRTGEFTPYSNILLKSGVVF
jgi:D-ribose pyranase